MSRAATRRKRGKAKRLSAETARNAVERDKDQPGDLRWEFLKRLDQIRQGMKATPQTKGRIKNWQEQFRKNLPDNPTALRAWKEILASRLGQDAAGFLYIFAHPVVFERVAQSFGKGSTFYSVMRQRFRAAKNERERDEVRSQRKKILNTAGPRSTFDRYLTLVRLQEYCAQRGVKLGLKRLAALAGCADPERSQNLDSSHLGRLVRKRADVTRKSWEPVTLRLLRNAPDGTGEIEEIGTFYVLK